MYVQHAIWIFYSEHTRAQYSTPTGVFSENFYEIDEISARFFENLRAKIPVTIMNNFFKIDSKSWPWRVRLIYEKQFT